LHKVAIHDLNQVFNLGFDHSIYDIHAGTAISNRLRFGLSNSFNIISANGKIEHYWFDEKKNFFKLCRFMSQSLLIKKSSKNINFFFYP
jgi:hypothetical protein